ncbi:MAG: hypothetical protein ACJA0F_002494 [Dinoroseobacter sp.]|jgi:hypothetical protein
MMYQTAFLNRLSTMQGLFEGIENKVSFRKPRNPPADNAISKRIDDERHIEFGMRPPSVRGPCRTPCQVDTQVKSLTCYRASSALCIVDRAGSPNAYAEMQLS